MNTFFAYIFKHKHYHTVVSQYEEIMQSYSQAYKIWSDRQSFQDKGNFESKEFVYKAYRDIKNVDRWIKSCQSLKHSQTEGFSWFLDTHRIRRDANFTYDDYMLISKSSNTINDLQGIWKKAHNLIQNKTEALGRFIVHKDTYSYDDLKSIAKAEDKILSYDKVLDLGHKMQTKYPIVWPYFSKGRKFDDISMSELATITENAFTIKEQYVKLSQKKTNRNLLNLIYRDSDDLESFSKSRTSWEESAIHLLSEDNFSHLDSCSSYQADIHLEDEKEMKRAIMDSEYYGTECNFCTDFTVENFYDFRLKFDKIEVAFDDAVIKTKSNYEAIKSYNKEKSGNSVVYIENYLDICTPDSSLCKYVDIYNQQKQIRDKASSIAQLYPLGFSAYYEEEIDFKTCDLSLAKDVVDAESKIRTRQNKEEEKERRRKELERQRIEEERKASDIRTLRSCVSSWDTLWGGLPYNYLFPYYPTTCGFEANQDEWNNRYLVWNFKNSKGKTSPLQYESALENLVPRIYRLLSNTFGYELSKLTLVCIPASSRENNERRFKEFSDRLTRESGMGNAFNHIFVTEDATPKHLGGSGMPTLGFDDDYFSGRYIILFDDVITRGNSMLRFKQQMEQLGSVVIAGVSIGRTKHERI